MHVLVTYSKPCVVCGRYFTKPASCSRANWPKRKCCSVDCGNALKRGRPNPKLSEALRGRKPSPATIAKQQATMKRLRAEGKIRNARANLGLRREATSQWKGDDIKYRGAHSRLNRERGRPNECEHCGTTTAKKFEWALRHDAEVRKTDTDGQFAGFDYSPRPNDYLRLCTACHHEYDGRGHRPNGQFA